MRTSITVAVVTICLGLAGCSLFGKKQTGSGPSKPFLGSKPDSPPPAAPIGGAETTSAEPLAGASPVLAGSVNDASGRHPGKVDIQVVDMDDPKATASAPLDFEAKDGFFYLPGLKVGHHYRLIARSKDGDRILTGQTLATPPNTRVAIRLSEDLAAKDTPPTPPPPTPPGRSSSGGSAVLDPPAPMKPGENPPKSDNSTSSNPSGGGIWAPNPDPPATSTPPAPAPDRMAGDRTKTDGWDHVPPPPPVVVPPSLPPAPQSWNTEPPNQTPPGARALPPFSPAPETPSFPGAHIPTVTTPVPSCVVVRGVVDNFALNDLNLEPWEYKRHHRGRVVLLDFWRSGCVPCLEAMGHLAKLQQTYGPYGLEIIGIAYMQGTPTDQVAKVRGVRARYGVTYTTLLGAGPTCPVKTQFQVSVFPTLVLLNSDGQIVWHSGNEGLGDEYRRRELEMEIRRLLGIR